MKEALKQPSLLAAAAAVAMAIGLSPASAADYPTQKVKVIVPFAAGGPTDVMARMVAQKLYPFARGEPGDIASIAVFLASDESRMLTGTTIAADGGRSSYLRFIAEDGD